MISMKHLNILVISLAAATLLVSASSGLAQGRKARAAAPSSKEQVQSDATASNPKSDTVRAAELYKSSLQDLLVVREEAVKKAAEQAANLKELYRDGIISRRDLEASEKALSDAQASADEVRRKIDSTDQLIEEASAEAEGA